MILVTKRLRVRFLPTIAFMPISILNQNSIIRRGYYDGHTVAYISSGLDRARLTDLSNVYLQ